MPGTSIITRSVVRCAVLTLLFAAGLLVMTGTGGYAAQASAAAAINARPEPLPPLPSRAPDPAEAASQPEQWMASEVADAKRICAAVAAQGGARFEILAPRREGHCGAPAPIRLESIGEATPVRFVPAPVVTCDLVAGLAKWIARGLNPLAERHLDSAVSEVRVMSSYACRTRYGKAGARMSEHAFANALDIAGFRLADGREVSVLGEWGATRRDLLAAARRAKETAEPILPPAPAAGPINTAADTRPAIETAAALPPVPVRRPLRKAVSAKAAPKTTDKARRRPVATRAAPSRAKRGRLGGGKAAQDAAPRAPPEPDRDARRFLRESHKVACAIFGTTLGPEANEAHRNHFHVDMFPRRNRGYCE